MLVGRQRETAVVETALADVRNGLSAVLVVRGEAGIGKTALVEHAVRSVDETRLLRVTGIESETKFAHAALHRLLLPFLPDIENLPNPQYLALATAFGLVRSAAPDRFLLGLATLTLLARSAQDTPLLCLIDDAQWLDQASIDVMTFVARRLLADPVGILFCVRDQADGDSFAGLPDLHVHRLNESDSLALLEDRVGSCDPHVARRILTEACGNPLAITVFAQQLTSPGPPGAPPYAEELPVSDRVEAHYLRQIRSLSRQAQTLLLLAAAEPSGDTELLERAAALLGMDADALADAQDAVSDFIAFRPGAVFRHPLVRSAVYGGAPTTLLRDVHSALAHVTDERTDPDRRSWHLAAAASDYDEDTALQLERTAGRARARGGYATESTFLARAAELTPDRGQRGRRLLSAAEAATLGGDYQRGHTLLTQADPLLIGPHESARAARLRGISLSPLGRPAEAPAALMTSARALGEFDRALARQTWSAALSSTWLSLRQARDTTLREVAEAALAAAPTLDDGSSTGEDLLRIGIATRAAIGYTEAAPVLRRAIAMLIDDAESGTDATFPPVLAFLAAHELWDPDNGRTLLALVAERERQRGALMNLWFCLETLSYTQRWAGRLATARSLEDEAQTIRDAIGLGQAWKFPRIEMMALRGQDSELRQAIEANTNLINGEGLGVSSATYQLAMAFHALSRGQYDDAYRLARIIYDEDAPLYGNQILPELVEAAVRVGEFDVARATVHRLKVRALASGTNWARGLLLRSQGLLAVGDHAESCYQGAIDHLRRARVPLDHARAHLLYGEWLRRKRRIEDAATQLRVAHDMFAAAGAGGFADRAHSELSAAGGHAGRRVVEDDRVLTPQEEQVSRLAARGMTNKEIAATLFISESTAAYHLKKVFRKLNLTSRRELRRRLIE